MVGSSWNAADSSGLAPIRSPAATNTECFFLARRSLTSVAMCSAPPAETAICLVLSVGSAMAMPPSGGLRCPWKSLMARIVTETPACEDGGTGGLLPGLG